MSDLPYYLAFSHCLGIGPLKFNNLMDYFGDVKVAYRSKERILSDLLGLKTARKFVEFRERFDLHDKLGELYQKNILILTRKSRRYPKQLLGFVDAPICLYLKGDLKSVSILQDYLFAIVGTRTPTSYGASVARRFSRELGSLGFTIVSGMAMGIDSEAHWGALDSHSKTIAILGCGVDIPYPTSNADLYRQILEKGGLIISEFPPGMTVQPGLFISRNRLISGLSKGVLVIEGAKDSGALITAKCAGEQGKEVFAVPANITSTMSEAPNFLLKQGAKLVTKVEDILEEFNLKVTLSERERIKVKLSEDEEKVYNLLLKENKTTDEIAEDLRISVNNSMELITGLEIKKVIEKNFEGKYQLRN